MTATTRAANYCRRMAMSTLAVPTLAVFVVAVAAAAASEARHTSTKHHAAPSTPTPPPSKVHFRGGKHDADGAER